MEKNSKDYNKLNKKYKFEIDLKVISSEKKMPAFLRFTCNEREKEQALQLYNEAISELKSKIKKVFCSEYIIKDNIKEFRKKRLEEIISKKRLYPVQKQNQNAQQEHKILEGEEASDKEEVGEPKGLMNLSKHAKHKKKRKSKKKCWRCKS